MVSWERQSFDLQMFEDVLLSAFCSAETAICGEEYCVLQLVKELVLREKCEGKRGGELGRARLSFGKITHRTALVNPTLTETYLYPKTLLHTEINSVDTVPQFLIPH